MFYNLAENLKLKVMNESKNDNLTDEYFSALFCQNTAIDFIEELFKLDKKEIPDFAPMTYDEIITLYGKTLRELNEKLMMSRNIPIEPKYLDDLKILDLKGVLPISTSKILRSIYIKNNYYENNTTNRQHF